MIIRRQDVQAISFDQLSIYDYTAGQPSNSSFAIIHVPPGARHSRAYSTRSAKCYYLIAGELEFILEDTHALSAGDCCLISCGDHFSYRNNSGTTAILALVHTPSFELTAEVFLE